MASHPPEWDKLAHVAELIGGQRVGALCAVDNRINCDGMSAIHVTAPAIAALTATTTQGAHKMLRAGGFGTVVQRGRQRYVALTAVEQRIGTQFTEQQLESAAARGYARLIRVNTTEG